MRDFREVPVARAARIYDYDFVSCDVIVVDVLVVH